MFEYSMTFVLGESQPKPKSVNTTTPTDGKASTPLISGKEEVSDKTADQPGSMTPLILMSVVFAFFIFMQVRSGKKAKQKKAQMSASLKKGQKAQTIGGIIGTIHSVSDSHIVLKTDESTQTKMTFTKSAIATVLDEDQLAN